MKLEKLNTGYFFSLLFLTALFVLVIFWPFLTAVLVAAILAVLFQSPYQWLVKKTRGRQGLSATIILCMVMLIVVLPFIGIAGLITAEVKGMYDQFSLNEQQIEMYVIDAQNFLASVPLIDLANPEELLQKKEVTESLKNTGTFVLDMLQAVYRGVSSFIFWVFVMLFSLFYFLIDGKAFMTKIMDLSPLKNRQEEMLIEKFTSISRAMIKGTFIIGVIQGTLGGLMFWATGVSSPVTWGVIMIILSIIPVIGSGLVWFPVGIAMLFLGNILGGLVILLFGFGVISVIDNILRPKLVGKDTQIHPLLIFFATLGGIMIFGLVGFLIGPIVVTLFLALMDIYEMEFAKELKKINNG